MDSLKIGNLSQSPLEFGGKVQRKDQEAFSNVIKGAIEKVDRLEKESDRSIVELLQGKTTIHETMIALQKADISMRLLLNIRNKAMESYREIMHMQF